MKTTFASLRLLAFAGAAALLLPAARAGELAPAAFVGPLPEASNASLTARAWGYNGDGALGNGTTTATSTPFQVDPTDLTNIIQVAAGNASSYALAGDGSLWVWGGNGNGQLGLGNNTTQYTTPQHLLAPGGQFYQLIDSDSTGTHAMAILGDTAPGIAPVPEPATWAAGALTVLAGGVALRRRLRRA